MQSNRCDICICTIWNESTQMTNILLLVLTLLWTGLSGPLLVFSYMSSSLSDDIYLQLGRAILVVNLTSLVMDSVLRIKFLHTNSLSHSSIRTRKCVNCTLCVLRILEIASIVANATLFVTRCLQDGGSSCMGQDIYLELIQLTQIIVIVGSIVVLGLFACAASCLHWNSNPLVAYSPPPLQPRVQESEIVEIQLAKSTDRRFSASNCAICMEHIQKESREKLDDKNESECKNTQQYKQGNRCDSQCAAQEEVETSEEQQLLHLKCGHFYHSTCLVKWIHSGPSGHLNCPLCNKECVLLLNEEGN